MFLFQLINQQIFTPWRKMITIGILGKTLRKHTKKQTEGKFSKSIMKRKKLLKNYQLMIELRKWKKIKHLLQ